MQMLHTLGAFWGEGSSAASLCVRGKGPGTGPEQKGIRQESLSRAAVIMQATLEAVQAEGGHGVPKTELSQCDSKLL